MKVEVRAISRSQSPRLITLTETLNVLDITKTESNNCFILHWTKKMEVMYLLLHWQEATQRLRSFGVIQIRISDPRSVWVMVHQKKRWIHDQSRLAGSFDAPWSRHLGSLTPIRITPKERSQSAWTRLDYPRPWVSLTWLLYNMQLRCHGHWFWKFAVCLTIDVVSIY